MIRGVMNAGATVESHKAAILAALQITDELFKSATAGKSSATACTRSPARFGGSFPRGSGAVDGGSQPPGLAFFANFT